MNTEQLDHPRTDLINDALASLRTGQEAFGKAYYEFRHLPKAGALAEMRLVYTVLERHLFQELEREGLHKTARNQRDTGPFAQDPRSRVFGIGETLVFGYLHKSDAKLMAVLEGYKGELNLDNSQLKAWRAASAVLAEGLELELAASSEPQKDERREDSYALCG
ncbi:hypothetical protein [Pelagicoccus sp. SDUM812002]|uniref:hypothetical protein n=1 Tax=Pelagicoccus sp. SDUM812002 TaxID=3041266 RepID=UPI0028117932|nr:hypothetical protein [Pelagicoccus sp. SDUM812002]